MRKPFFIILIIVIETIIFAGALYFVSQKSSTASGNEKIEKKIGNLMLNKDLSNVSTNSKLIANNLIDLILSNDDIAISELLGFMKKQIPGIKNIYLIDKNKKIIGTTDSKKLYTNFTGKIIPAEKDTSTFALQDLQENTFDIATAIKIGDKRLGELHILYVYNPPKMVIAGSNGFNKVLSLVLTLIIVNIIILFLLSLLMPKGLGSNVKFESANEQELKLEQQKLNDEIQEIQIKSKNIKKEIEDKDKELAELNEKIATSKEEETAILKHIEELQQREEELSKKTDETDSTVDSHVNVQIMELKEQLDNLETEVAIKQKAVNKLETNIELLKQEMETLSENKDKTLSELNGIELDLNKRILMKRREEIKLTQHLEALRKEESKIKPSINDSKAN